jgi:hypothetical protein
MGRRFVVSIKRYGMDTKASKGKNLAISRHINRFGTAEYLSASNWVQGIMAHHWRVERAIRAMIWLLGGVVAIYR